MNKSYLNIKQLDNVGEIDIFGYIGDDFWNEDSNSSKNISEKLNELEALEVDSYRVTINSLGGDVNHALAIYNLLRKKGKPVETEMIGMCASSATIIAMAGNTRKISENALFLVHKCSSMVCGNENELQEELKTQQLINDTIANIYAEVSGTAKDTVVALMEENNGQGIWLSAKVVKEYGFATEIVKENKRSNEARHFFGAADIELSGLPSLPNSYFDRSDGEAQSGIIATIKELFTDLKNTLSMKKENQNTVEHKFDNIALTAIESDGSCVVALAEMQRIDAEMASAKKAIEDEKTQNANLEKEVADLKNLLEKATTNTAVNGNDPVQNEKSFADWAKSQPYYNEVEALTR